MGSTKPRSTVSRYSNVRDEVSPGVLPREGQRGKAHIKLGAVPDPNTARQGKRQQAGINIKTDALENEYACNRVSEAAYRAGRAYQRILEISHGKPTGGGQWMEGDRVDAATAHELTILRSIETAEKAVSMIFGILPVIGARAAGVLRMVLVERLTLTEVAMACEGKAERMQVSFYAETFRRSLEEIADHWSKTITPT